MVENDFILHILQKKIIKKTVNNNRTAVLKQCTPNTCNMFEDDLKTIHLQFNKKQAENSYLLQQIHNIMKLEMVEVPTTL